MSGKMRHRLQVDGCIGDAGSCQDRGALRAPRSRQPQSRRGVTASWMRRAIMNVRLSTRIDSDLDCPMKPGIRLMVPLILY
jgi:hypothetical protein